MATCSLDRWLSVATDTYPALLVLFNALLVFRIESLSGSRLLGGSFRSGIQLYTRVILRDATRAVVLNPYTSARLSIWSLRVSMRRWWCRL